MTLFIVSLKIFIKFIKIIFPTHRPRRLRSHAQLRRMVRETVLTTNNLIYPLFAVPVKALISTTKHKDVLFISPNSTILSSPRQSLEILVPRLNLGTLGKSRRLLLPMVLFGQIHLTSCTIPKKPPSGSW